MTDGHHGYEPTPINQLQAGDHVLVDLTVEATIELNQPPRLVVTHGTTAHVIYPSTPTLWRRPQ